MSKRKHQSIPNPYDFNPKNQNRSGRQHGIGYQDDSLSPINSDDEENYLQKDKHGKVNNYFRPKTSSNEKTKTKEADDTKERLARLESMLEKLINRNEPLQPGTPSLITKESGSDKRIVRQKVNSKDVEFALEPRNHHFTTSMWITKIQEVSIRNNYSEKSTIQFMEKQMTGIIKAWYKSLPTRDFSWPELKLLITKTFPDNYDFITTLKRLVTRIKLADETMTNYYYSKMYLIEACKIAGEDAVSCLIDGLNNNTIQDEAKSQNYLTPETLYSQYLMTLPEYTVDYSPLVPNSVVQDQMNQNNEIVQEPSPLCNWYYQNEPQIETNTPNLMFQYQPPPGSETMRHHQKFEHVNHELHFEAAILPQGNNNQEFEERVPVHSRLGDKDTLKMRGYKKRRIRSRFE